MDFLSYYSVNTTTNLSSTAYSTTDIASIKTIVGKSMYHQFLVEFPDLTRLPVFGKGRTRHSVKRHIKTTQGLPVYSKPRRLTPDCLKHVKAEFEMMLEQGVIRPSKSLGVWASPLHGVPKKDGGIRPCDDYQALNAHTILDRYSPLHFEDFAQQLRGSESSQNSISSARTIKFR